MTSVVYRTVVVKIGSSSLTNELGVINEGSIAKLCNEVAAARANGHRVIIVTSGSVSAGVAALGLAQRPTDTPTLQALSAAGQPRLMQVYDRELCRHGLVPAQVLLTPVDFVNRKQYLHARQTINRLLELGAIPIVNENDAIADHKIRFGDNDRIAALLSHLIRADLLVLLTDTDGLYTSDPRVHPGAAVVSTVEADDPMLHVQAGSTGSNRGSGGMASKLSAARIASSSGIPAVIAHASRHNALADALGGRTEFGTTFRALDRRLSARKLWIAFAAGTAGRLIVDAGAQRAVVDAHRSLLPAGITEVDGEFDTGDTVDIVGPTGVVFARGMVAYPSSALRRTSGVRRDERDADVTHEAVNRDDLVVL